MERGIASEASTHANGFQRHVVTMNARGSNITRSVFGWHYNCMVSFLIHQFHNRLHEKSIETTNGSCLPPSYHSKSVLPVQ